MVMNGDNESEPQSYNTKPLLTVIGVFCVLTLFSLPGFFSSRESTAEGRVQKFLSYLKKQGVEVVYAGNITSKYHREVADDRASIGFAVTSDKNKVFNLINKRSDSGEKIAVKFFIIEADQSCGGCWEIFLSDETLELQERASFDNYLLVLKQGQTYEQRLHSKLKKLRY
jgi:hypothetical protein